MGMHVCNDTTVYSTQLDEYLQSKGLIANEQDASLSLTSYETIETMTWQEF